VNGVNTFWLTVMNVALGVAVLSCMFVLVVSVIEEMLMRRPAMHLHRLHLRSHRHPGRFIGRQ